MKSEKRDQKSWCEKSGKKVCGGKSRKGGRFVTRGGKKKYGRLETGSCNDNGQRIKVELGPLAEKGQSRKGGCIKLLPTLEGEQLKKPNSARGLPATVPSRQPEGGDTRRDPKLRKAPVQFLSHKLPQTTP